MTSENVNAIEKEKDEVFAKIVDLLLQIGGEQMSGLDRAAHVMDILEEVSARVIASCSANEEAIDELCDTFSQNLRLLAKHFQEQDGKNK